MDLSKYRALFVTESRDHLEGMGKDLLALEKDPTNRASLDNLFRQAHSIKGMAASMGYDAITQLSHKLEDLADLARRGATFDQDAVQLWLEGTDWLLEAVTLVEAGREAEVVLPPLMDRVLQKAAQLVGSLPGAASTTFPRLVAVTPPTPATTLPAVTPPAPAASASSSGTTTEPRLPAVPEPSQAITGSLPAVPAPSQATTGSLPAVPAPPVVRAATVLPPGALPPGTPLPTRPVPTLPGPAPNATLILPAVGGGAARAGPQATLLMQAVAAQEWLVDVTISDAAATPHVRAFVVHKRITEKLEVLEMAPALAELRRGVFPDRTMRLKVRGTLDQTAVRALVMALPDVLAVSVNPVADLAAAPAGSTSPTGTRAAVPEPAAAQRTVRVRTELLDDLIDSVGEILLARSRLRQAAGRLEDPELHDLADEFARLAQGLHERVMGARMMPLTVVADRLPRVVRDLARKRGKEVQFNVEGMDLELDRAILDELHDPLLHLVRNAVDHAHEGPQARMAAGKPAVMTLTLSATRDRDHVLVTVKDNGKGLDPDALRRSAVEKGLMTAEAAQALGDQAAREIICMAGFSTAAEVDDTSGRGVGMDAVRSTVERLGGQLLLESRKGEGTSFTLRMPLTVAIIQVLLVGAGPLGAPYAVPLHRVDHAVAFDPDAVVRNAQDALYPVGDLLAPLHDMGALLGFAPALGRPGTVVVLDDPYQPRAIRVDRVLGQQDVVVKPLGAPLSSVPYISGAALLADGSPTYILDLAKLVSAPSR